MNTHPDQHYIEGLLKNDNGIIQAIYENCSGKVKSWIINNSGSSDDAADVFQEALIDLYQQAKAKSFTLSCPLEAFLLLVCKRKWLNKLKKDGRAGVTIPLSETYTIGEDVFANIERFEVNQSQYQLFEQMFEKLSEKCREMISLSFKEKSQEKIAAQLNVSYGYFRKKKSECIATLSKLIRKAQKTEEGHG